MAKEKALHSRTIDLKAYLLHLTSISFFFFFFELQGSILGSQY